MRFNKGFKWFGPIEQHKGGKYMLVSVHEDVIKVAKSSIRMVSDHRDQLIAELSASHEACDELENENRSLRGELYRKDCTILRLWVTVSALSVLLAISCISQIQGKIL